MNGIVTSDRPIATTPATGESSASLAGLLPWLAAALLYLVVLSVGENLLNDADSLWHLTVAEWIVANGLPHTDPFSFTFQGSPWIAKEWLSQLLLLGAFRLGGWSGVVVLAAAAFALAFGLLAQFLIRRLAPIPTLILVTAAFLLAAPHAVARPHLLALPVMVAWVTGLVRAADRGTEPSPWLLPLMIVWANLHGGFLLGILLAGAVGLDAIVSAEPAERRRVALVWVRFAVLALAAACITPYGPEAILTAWRILSLQPTLSLISEWRPADFSHVTGLEVVLLAAVGFALWRGVRLPPVRILIVLGLVHLALSAERNAEVFGLLAPLFVAAPLARQFPPLAAAHEPRPAPLAAFAVLALLVLLTYGAAWVNDYRPDRTVMPEAAVMALREADAGPVLNDYGFGGYLIHAGVPTFIDGRTELYGDFLVRYYRAINLADLGGLTALLDEYAIGATMLAPQTPAVAWLDMLPDWRRLHGDAIAVVHVRAAP